MGPVHAMRLALRAGFHIVSWSGHGFAAQSMDVASDSADRCRTVDGNRAQHAEQRGVARHLEAELADLLKADGDEPGYGAHANPVRHLIVLVLTKSPADLANQDAKRNQRGHADEQSALCRELQVVIVRF